MKLLVIEDNARLLNSLKKHLSKHFVLHCVQTGEEGIYQAEYEKYDVILLDLGLPDRTGQEVCQAIRKVGVDTPILILTVTNQVDTKVQLLNLGADDYVVKPFHISELIARIQNLGRRKTSDLTPNTLTVGDLIIDTGGRLVCRGGKVIQLRRKEFDILEYLARNRDKVLTRAMIMDHVWETGTNSWNSTVDVHIKHLRDKVDRPFPKPLIQTAYGIGYKISAKG